MYISLYTDITSKAIKRTPSFEELRQPQVEAVRDAEVSPDLSRWRDTSTSLYDARNARLLLAAETVRTIFEPRPA